MNIRIFIACIFISLLGCSSQKDISSPLSDYTKEKEITFTQNLWIAEKIQNTLVDDKTTVTLLVGNDNTLSGKSGCNRYNSQFLLEGNTIKIYRSAASLMACSPKAMSIESQYYEALEKSKKYDIDNNGKLKFLDEQDKVLITFNAIKNAYQSVVGSVSYLERMALPPNAILTVSLLDVSLMDVPAKLIASAEYSFSDQQVPIDYRIKYLGDKIDQRHSYSIQAKIKVDGKLLFTSTTSNPVITRGNDNSVDVLVKKISLKQSEKSSMVNYSCDRGTYLTASFTTKTTENGEKNIVIINSDKISTPIILAQQPSGSGFLYSNSKYSLRGKGDEAKWTVGRMKSFNCRSDKTGKQSEDIL